MEQRYAVRFGVVCKYFGEFCLVVAALAAVPLAVSLWFGDATIAFRYTIVMLGLSAVGATFSRIRAPRRVQANEGMVIVVLLFIAVPMVMTFPMMAAGLTFMDALFEAVSGATTTGLSTLVSVEHTSPTFRFARAWMQWYGGLGIVVLSLALVTEPGSVSKGLGVTENVTDDLMGGLKAYSRRILAIYVSITAGSIVALWLVGTGGWEGVEYAMAAVSTGGFASHDDSLAGLGAFPVQTAVIAICFLGSVPFVLYHRALRRRFPYDANVAQLVVLLASCVLVGLVLGTWRFFLFGDVGWVQTMEQASLLAVSAQTTAGFSTTDVSALDPFSKLLLVLVMAVGGGTGSTAGGFKILRLIILIRLVSLMILRTSITRHAVVAPTVANRRLEHDEIREAVLLVLVFVAGVVISWLPFVASGYDPLDSLFEVVSATATVGLSAGVTSIDLPPLLKGILCLDMWLGRLEIVAWLVFFYPRTWFGRRMEES